MKSIIFSLLPIAFIPACTPAGPITPAADPAVVESKMIRLQEKFPDYDTDGDDRISSPELNAAMIRNGGQNVTDAKVQKVMSFYDFNKDGKISLREAQSGAVSGPEELIRKVQ